MVDSVVRCRGLVVIRGDVRAVDGIDLDLRPGGITGLLGPSGSGKSTLMRAIVGSQIISAGGIEVFGSPAGAPAVRARIGYMAQQPALYSDLTVRENLEYFGTVLRVDRGRVDELIDVLSLADRRDALVRTLSGGESSRVSLGIALLNDPDLLILDEPTVGLDPLLRRDLWTRFRTLADRGMCLLVSSHVMDEARRCDRLLLMRQGRLLFDGSNEELVSRAGTADLDDAFIRLAEGEER